MDEKELELKNAWKINQYLADENEMLRLELEREHRYVDIVKKTTQDVNENEIMEIAQAAMKIVKACGYRVVYGE
jgi:predicted patatin/cPLA2 family phospholipase